MTDHLAHSTVRLTDTALAVWAAVVLLVGLLLVAEVSRLEQLADASQYAARAARDTGDALESLAALPVVGGGLAELGREVDRAGARAERASAEAKSEVRRVSLLLGAALVVLPAGPVLAVYAPLRLAWSRERRAVARAIRENDPGEVESTLARRAATRLPADRAIALAGEQRALALAELRRLGLEPPGAWGPTAAARA